MATNETGAEGSAASEEGAGEAEFELDDNGEPVIGEDGKPKPKTDDGKGQERQRRDETPEQKQSRLTRELDQHQKKNKLGKYAEGAGAEDKGDKGKKSGLDYGQKAFLIASDVKAPDEQALAERLMKETGKELDALVNSPYFKSELKELREARAAEDAIPDSRRTGQTSVKSVEYWVAKGELPPDTVENRELRTKVVKARREKESRGDVFSKNSVVGGH